MSSKTDSDTSPRDFDTNTVHSGRCKWFNNKAGYGFLTVVRSTDDDMVGKDVFAHHTGISVSNEQYRYLVQGEYVDFKMRETDSGQHSIQASDVTGLAGGQLMCETRYENRKQQEQNADNEGGDERRAPRRNTRDNSRGGGRGNGRGGRRGSAQVRLRGEGPREGEVWTLTRSNEKRARKEDPPKENE